MALMRFLPDPPPGLASERLVLRPPRLADYQAWASLRAESRSFLTPWEPLWPPDDLTRNAFRRRLRRYQREAGDDLGHTYFLFLRENTTLVGGLTLANLRRGVTQTCSLGYWMGARFAGRGFMTEAVRCIASYVFDEMHLHRIEAACLPSNAASQRVLERCGFEREGQARHYLKINGHWADHLLYALLASDPRP